MAKEAANRLLPYLVAFPVRMGDALRAIGFKVWVTKFKDSSISGVLALNARKEFPMVIGVNEEDSHGHQCFTLAHELAHYIFDIQDDTGKLIRAHYNTSMDNDKNLVEYRANKFATELLMPELEFKKGVMRVRQQYKNEDVQIEGLSLMFDVSKTAVERRIEELKIGA